MGERPQSVHWSELFGWLAYNIAEALTLITHFYKGLGILMHSGPVVSYLYELVN